MFNKVKYQPVHFIIFNLVGFQILAVLIAAFGTHVRWLPTRLKNLRISDLLGNDYIFGRGEGIITMHIYLGSDFKRIFEYRPTNYPASPPP